jgi:hypothetical protein
VTNKFKIGQKVKTKFFSGATEGTIISIMNSYYIVEFIDKGGFTYTYSYQEDEIVESDDIFVHKCECGAVFTAFPEAHAYYCPRFKKGM